MKEHTRFAAARLLSIAASTPGATLREIAATLGGHHEDPPTVQLARAAWVASLEGRDGAREVRAEAEAKLRTGWVPSDDPPPLPREP